MKKIIAVALASTLIACMSAHARSAQDTGNLVFENDQLRAVEYTIPSGGRLSFQTRAPYLFFGVSPFVATLTFQDGESVAASFKDDDPRWYETPLSAVTNTGKNEVRFLIIELKKPAGPQGKLK